MRRVASIFLLALVLSACGAQHANKPHVRAPGIQHRLAVRYGGASTLTVGESLYASNGSWANLSSSFTYQWLACDTAGASCVNAAGSPSTNRVYTLDAGDAGDTMRVAVTGNNGGTQTSPQTGVVQGGGPFVGADEFAAASIGTANWDPVDNTIGNTNSVQCDQAAQDTESGGNLSVTLATGSFTCPGPTGGNGGILTCPSGTCSSTLAGGEVHWRDFAFQDGTIVVNAKMFGQSGAGNGAWPAVWMLGYYCQHPAFLVAGNDPPPCAWPAVGSEEIDIGEIKDWAGSADAEVWSNLFANGSTGGTTCTPTAGSGLPGGFTASGAFHAYELDWTSSQLTFKVDGVTTCTDCTASSGCTNNNQTLPSTPMFLLLTGTQMESTTQPSNKTSLFDYVHVTPSGPIPSVSPSISGSLTHGSALSASTGTWSGSPTFKYQWLTCNGSGLSCSYITTGSSCTSTPFTCAASYTTTLGEAGDTIQVLVQATNGSGVVAVGSSPSGTVS